MGRIRSIKPDTFISDDVNGLSVHARWTFVGLWCYVDDEGRGRADPRLIKAAVWPIDDSVTAADVAAHLDEMERRRMICRYEADGIAFMHVVNFDKHQRINRATDSKIPPCSREVHGGIGDRAPIDPRRLSEPSVSPHGALSESSRQEQGTGKGNREQGTGVPPSAGALALAVPRPVNAEVVDPDPPGTAVAIPDPPVNAGTIVGAWIDHCAANGVKLTKRSIGHYAKVIKTALDEGFPPNLIKTALANMLAEGVAGRPGYLDGHLIAAQTGPRRRPRRLTPGEESARALVESAPDGAQVIELFRLAVGGDQ